MASNCRHRNRTLTGRIRPMSWPPKREYKCNGCNRLAWEGWMPRAYIDILKMQRELPQLVQNEQLSIGGTLDVG